MALKNNRVFADSNFFIALINPSDTLYQKALAISQRIKRGDPSLVISDFVFLEIVTVLSQRVNRKRAISFGEDILKDKQLEIIHIDERLNNLSWEIFQEIKKKDTSFVDCSTLAILKSYQIKKLLTFDKEDFAGLRKEYRFSFY